MGFLVTVHLSRDNETIMSCNYQKMSNVIFSYMERSANQSERVAILSYSVGSTFNEVLDVD